MFLSSGKPNKLHLQQMSERNPLEQVPPYELVPISKSATCPYCQDETLQLGTGWSFLEGIYCITLQDRLDRQEIAEKELHRVGLCRFATMYRTAKSTYQTQTAHHGVFMSHREITRVARDLGQSPILVLEDDFQFSNNLPLDQMPQYILESIQSLPSDWTRLQLGYWDLLAVPYNRHVNRTASVLAHAMIWSSRGRDLLADRSFHDKHFDHELALFPKSYSTRSLLTYQASLGTDNSDKAGEALILSPGGMEAVRIWYPLVVMGGGLVVLTTLIFLCWKYGMRKSVGAKEFGKIMVVLVIITLLVMCAFAYT
jgi:hypothetical protein